MWRHRQKIAHITDRLSRTHVPWRMISHEYPLISFWSVGSTHNWSSRSVAVAGYGSELTVAIVRPRPSENGQKSVRNDDRKLMKTTTDWRIFYKGSSVRLMSEWSSKQIIRENRV